MYTKKFICQECGQEMFISRRYSKRHKEYHIKDLYCIKCKEVTKFLECDEYDIIPQGDIDNG